MGVRPAEPDDSPLQSLIDDLKASTGVALRMTSLIAAVAISFLRAAAFAFVLQHYGIVPACLAGAAVFFVVTLIAAGGYLYQRRQTRRSVEAAKAQAKSAFATVMSDPMMVAAGLQIVRAVGVKRLLPVLAIGGLAFGLMAQRKSSGESPAE